MEYPCDDCSFICESCGSNRVVADSNTGEYYCEDCGIQQQEIRGLDRDLDDIYFELTGGGDGSRNIVRRASQTTARATQSELSQSQDAEQVAASQNSQNYSLLSQSDNSRIHQTLIDIWFNNKPSIIKNEDFFIGVQLMIQYILKDLVIKRGVKKEILKVTHKIWFEYLSHMCRAKIPIRTFFADLRRSVLKVPFNETFSIKDGTLKSNGEYEKRCEDNSINLQYREYIENNDFLKLVEQRMGFDRLGYIIKLCNNILKNFSNTLITSSSNSTSRKGSKDRRITPNRNYEEWEISARKLQILANYRNIPYTSWKSKHTNSRTDIIESVIDMIYEHDFLELYYWEVIRKDDGGIFGSITHLDDFNQWILGEYCVQSDNLNTESNLSDINIQVETLNPSIDSVNTPILQYDTISQRSNYGVIVNNSNRNQDCLNPHQLNTNNNETHNRNIGEDNVTFVNDSCYNVSSDNIDIDYQFKRIHKIHRLIQDISDIQLVQIVSSTGLTQYSQNCDLEMEEEESGNYGDNSRDNQNERSEDTMLEYPKLDFSLIITIIWIGLLKCGYPVTSSDIVEWVRTGKIDILKSDSLLPSWLKDAGFKWDSDMNASTNMRSVTQISRIPSSSELDKLLKFFRDIINIKIPSINIPLLIHRILSQCRCFSYSGNSAIQPLVISFWENLYSQEKMQYLLKGTQAEIIAASVIIIIARIVWPIFVYHPVPVCQEYNQEDISKYPEALESKVEPFSASIYYEVANSRWLAKIINEKTKSIDEKYFYSKRHGIEWSGVSAIAWLVESLSHSEFINKEGIKELVNTLLLKGSKTTKNKENIGRPTKSTRGDFYIQTRKNRKNAKKEYGANNWSGTCPIFPSFEFLIGDVFAKLLSLSKYLPSNREVFSSLLFEQKENELSILSDNNLLNSWQYCDREKRSQLLNSWKFVLSSNHSCTETSRILQHLVESISLEQHKDLQDTFSKNHNPMINDPSIMRISNERLDLFLDHLYRHKLNIIQTLFQNPGIFTSIIIPLPQYFHSKQKHTKVESSLPLAYILLLEHLSKIIGKPCSSIHSCVVEIEEYLASGLEYKD
ncbi:uncharacterized protein CMU_000650 [Cryptosporidium muris RN66]|uniref:Rrn7/TAF1B N-terminal cyclin domain-containing protein n=1 Tax=Cryptosporidium muris (strain RN66) TaxID=441375 RepID=B6AG54_CRYMR|nr:uncharacterized protein CMU_000650 [Cryptosporidium muris RN66]EEA07195.1 hypothetical protein, conserved [Cryptosporidium muris RN66]|eukprot:XP_002141544.1 hypothetical protein [Cryptosporidium muris RN66]